MKNESLLGNKVGTLCGLFKFSPETELQFQMTNFNMNNHT